MSNIGAVARSAGGGAGPVESTPRLPPSPSPPPPPAGAIGRDMWGALIYDFTLHPSASSPYSSLTDMPLRRPEFSMTAVEVNQSCSTAAITDRRKVLNAALCAPLISLPPYACTRLIRRPVLEVISLATSNAVAAMGAYMGIAALMLKRKLRREADPLAHECPRLGPAGARQYPHGLSLPKYED